MMLPDNLSPVNATLEYCRQPFPFPSRITEFRDLPAV